MYNGAYRKCPCRLNLWLHFRWLCMSCKVCESLAMFFNYQGNLLFPPLKKSMAYINTFVFIPEQAPLSVKCTLGNFTCIPWALKPKNVKAIVFVFSLQTLYPFYWLSMTLHLLRAAYLCHLDTTLGALKAKLLLVQKAAECIYFSPDSCTLL